MVLTFLSYFYMYYKTRTKIKNCFNIHIIDLLVIYKDKKQSKVYNIILYMYVYVIYLK